MNTNDIIGAIGVGITLLAYFLNIFSLIKENGVLFYSMNIVGAGIACYASFLISYTPFIILEGTWTIISVAGLLKTIKKPQE